MRDQDIRGVLAGGLFPVHGAGEIPGVEGPWFNFRGARAECSWVDWDMPNGQTVHVWLHVPCPRCEYPVLVPIRADTYRLGDDGQLSLGPVLKCPGYWVGRDASGAQTGQNVVCGWVGAIRHGLAHHPRCPALHQPGCPHPGGGPCGCRMSRGPEGQHDCRCAQ